MEDVEEVIVAESGEGVESTEESEERSADAAQRSIVVGVRETEESEFAGGHGDIQVASVSEVADGLGDVQSASVVEVDEVEVEEKFGGSVVKCVSENDVVGEDVQTPSVSSVEDSEERKEVPGGPDEQLEEDEYVQCSDGGSRRDGGDVDDTYVDENETGGEVSEDVCEAAGDECMKKLVRS